MKKTFIIIITALIALCCAGCNSSAYRLTATCCIDGRTLALPLSFGSAEFYGAGTAFSSSQTLEEIQETIDDAFADKTVKTELFGDILLIEESSGEKVHFFSVEKGTKVSDAEEAMTRYRFTNLSDSISGFTVMVPRHLISFSASELADSTFYVTDNKWYPTEYALSDFAAFYEKLGIYEISPEEHSFTARVKEGSVTGSHAVCEITVTFNHYAGDSIGFSAKALEE